MAPQIVANKTNNTITVRASANIVQIIQRVVEQNDNPKAEVVLDVQILEVNRGRAKQFGIDLSEFAINVVFSPETDPRGTADGTPTLTPQPFNLNTITRGISAADFYLSVPSAVVQFLETDTESRLIAKPRLRGAEGQQITLNLGDEIPVPATVFTPVAQGGANFNPHLVQLPSRRRQHPGHAACHIRRRHHPRPDRGEQHAWAGRQHRRPEPALVPGRERSRHACGCATVNRTCWPVCCVRKIGSRCGEFQA